MCCSMKVTCTNESCLVKVSKNRWSRVTCCMLSVQLETTQFASLLFLHNNRLTTLYKSQFGRARRWNFINNAASSQNSKQHILKRAKIQKNKINNKKTTKTKTRSPRYMQADVDTNRRNELERQIRTKRLRLFSAPS